MGAFVGVGVLLAGLAPSPVAAQESHRADDDGLASWAATPVPEAELAGQAGREGVLVVGEGNVVGYAEANGTITDTSIGDIGSTGYVGNIAVNGQGFSTVMINSGVANMVNSTTVNVYFNNVTTNAK